MPAIFWTVILNYMKWLHDSSGNVSSPLPPITFLPPLFKYCRKEIPVDGVLPLTLRLWDGKWGKNHALCVCVCCRRLALAKYISYSNNSCKWLFIFTCKIREVSAPISSSSAEPLFSSRQTQNARFVLTHSRLHSQAPQQPQEVQTSQLTDKMTWLQTEAGQI